MKLTTFLISFIILYAHVNGQEFYNSTTDIGIDHSYFEGEYGGGASFVDWDNDGWDDLSICQNGSAPLFYKNSNGTLISSPLLLSNNTEELKQMTWVDFDNDGDKDLFVTTHLGNFRLYQNNNGSLIDISIQAGLAQTEYLTYGNSWGDYNNDGYLDVYICNYNSDGVENILYKNNGDGTFDDVTSELNVGNGTVYSFQALWIDYNNDGWQDLFVINDRTIASNTLYRNDGGTFTDVSVAANMDYTIFSMSNTGGDYDNDGDLDFFVTNNPFGHLLHRNNNDGTFTEVGDSAGVATYDMGWAGQWIDYDLDGWQDLHVCCSPFWNNPGQNKFYTNNTDGTFDFDISMGFEGDEGWSHCSVVGDYNNDGHFDIFVVQDFPDQSKMWASIPGENNYLKVNLEGVISNRDGVGSRIELYNNELTQIRYTYCGEGYLSQNSFSEIFGLADAETVDSLKVIWLSGHEDVFYNINANETLNILEGSSLENNISFDGLLDLCPNDSILLNAGDFSNYLWSTGDTTSAIYASQPGEYSVTVFTENNLPINSQIIELTSLPSPVIEVSTNGIICFNDSSGSAWANNLEDTGIASIQWSNELFGDSVYNLSAGTYTCNLTDLNNCSSSIEFEIIETDEIIALFETEDVLCFGESNGTSTVTISGGSGTVEVDWNDFDNTSLNAGEYSINLIDSMGCMINSSFEIYQPDSLSIELDLTNADEGSQGSASIDITGGTEPYSILWSTNEEASTITDLSQGEYTVIVTDENGCIYTDSFSIINVSIEELSLSSIKIFPNPVGNFIYVQTNGEKVAEIEIFSNIGTSLIIADPNNSLEGDVIKVDVSSLPSGRYFLTLRTHGDFAKELSFIKL